MENNTVTNLPYHLTRESFFFFFHILSFKIEFVVHVSETLTYKDFIIHLFQHILIEHYLSPVSN